MQLAILLTGYLFFTALFAFVACTVLDRRKNGISGPQDIMALLILFGISVMFGVVTLEVLGRPA